MVSKEKKVILVLADISGFTKFMTQSKMELIHSQHLISELLKAILREVDIPLEVAEIEGDAVFMYAVKQDSKRDWQNTQKIIGQRLLAFIKAFSEKLEYLIGTNTCNCGACSNLAQLKLKVVVHAGVAVVDKIGNFTNLHGVDVILAHRLLKNSVSSDQYVLLTDQAQNELNLHYQGPCLNMKENYSDLGEIKTVVFSDPISHTPKEVQASYGFWQKTKRKMGLMAATMAIAMKINRPGKFNNLSESD